MTAGATCGFDAAGEALARASGQRIRGRAAWVLAITLLAVAVSAAIGVVGWFLV